MRVDDINRKSMNILEGDPVVFTMKAIMRIHGKEMEIEYENIKKGLLVEPELVLKVGAQVMCVVNIKNEKTMELCNGSQGIVTGFADGLPIVQFQNGVHRAIGAHIWESERMPNVGISQIPLILSWAISIHKSQGSTLDLAEIDIGSGIFECGQSYVALSRVKSLEGLYLSSYDPSKIQINKKVKEFYEKF
jgi:ATP-dependent DNA helicase PIF1